MRTEFIKALTKLAGKDKNVWLITGDVGYNKLEIFKEKFPERFINAGIAEANMIGIATGLALSGKKVFVYGITNFVVFRCYEQIRMAAYMKANIIVVGVGRDEEYKNNGISHYAYEDRELMSMLPIMIYQPEKKEQVKDAVMSAYNTGMSYISLSKE